MPLFVLNSRIHTLLRFIAAFIIGPLLVYKGSVYGDMLLTIVGGVTILVDSYTLYKSIK